MSVVAFRVWLHEKKFKLVSAPVQAMATAVLVARLVPGRLSSLMLSSLTLSDFEACLSHSDRHSWGDVTFPPMMLAKQAILGTGC